MPKGTDGTVEFGRVGRRVAQAAFEGGDIVSDGGVLLRQAWPRTKIIVRADSGFCRPRVLQRLERWGVSYIIGLQKNARLTQQVEPAERALADRYAAKRTKQRRFGEFQYAAHTWHTWHT